MDQLCTVLKGQEELTTFLYTLTHYHRQIFPGLNLPCTTEANEASFLPAVLGGAQGAGLCELPCDLWLSGHPAGHSQLTRATFSVATVIWGNHFSLGWAGSSRKVLEAVGSARGG